MKKGIRFVCVFLAMAALFSTFGGSLAASYTELSGGCSGQEVTRLQERLKELGFYTDAIDGDYGSATVRAVRAFQLYNSLKADGIATAELQELIFSENAKENADSGLKVTKVSFKEEKISITVKNNTAEVIDSVTLMPIIFNASGEAYSDYGSYGFVNGTRETFVKKLKPGQSGSYHIRNYTYFSETATASVAVGVQSYHMASGYTVSYHPDGMVFLKNDGTSVLPTIDPYKPEKVKDGAYAEASAVRIGYSYNTIPAYMSSCFCLPKGEYVVSIYNNTIAEKAGLEEGDVLVSIDGVDVLEPYATEKAKIKMSKGETVDLVYIRCGKEYTTQLALDMDAIAVKKTSSETFSVADELVKYGELLDQGVITQDEYDTLKQKLIYG